MLGDYLDPNYEDNGGGSQTGGPPMYPGTGPGNGGVDTTPVTMPNQLPQAPAPGGPGGPGSTGVTAGWTPSPYGGYAGGSWGPSAPPLFTPPDYQSLTSDQILAEDPGYQFRSQQGLDAIQRAAAAKGVLQTGGTLSSLADYNSGLASQEYANAFQRHLDTYLKTQYQPALDAYNSQYNGWYATNNWDSQQAQQQALLDYQAWLAYQNNMLGYTGLGLEYA